MDYAMQKGFVEESVYKYKASYSVKLNYKNINFLKI